MPYPLCVLVPELGVVSETFIRWDVEALLPGHTAVITDPPPQGQTVLQGPAWHPTAPTLAFTPVPGDPRPDADRQQAVVEFLAEHGVEVVLVQYLDVADRWFDLLRGAGVRIWLRGHGVDVSARLGDPALREAYRRYAEAEGITVPSRAAAHRLRGLGLPAEKIHVVRYPVHASVDPPTLRPPGEVVRCVAVGRLVPKKGPLLTLEAFRLAAARDRRLFLDVIGDGPMWAEVQEYVAEHGLADRVQLLGALPHAQTLDRIRSADMLLHHAVTAPDGDAEGLPLVILEAMGAGVPVVATRHEGANEVLTDGVDARLVAEHDTTAMAEAVIALAAAPGERHHLGLAAWRVIQTHHDPETCRHHLLTLLGLAEVPTA